MDTKSLTVEDTFQSIGLWNMTKGAIVDFTSLSMATQRHFAQIILMQKFACRSFHAKISKPMAAYNCSKTRIVFGTCQDRFSFFTGCKNGSCLTIRKRVKCFWNPMFQSVVLKIILNCVNSQRICGKERRRHLVVLFWWAIGLGEQKWSARADSGVHIGIVSASVQVPIDNAVKRSRYSVYVRKRLSWCAPVSNILAITIVI